MITIIAKSKVIENKIVDFKRLAEKLVEDSRKEEGCVSYGLYQDINDKCNFTFIEVWRDSEAIELHNNSKHFTSIVPQLGQLREEQSQVSLYEKVI